MKKYKYIGGYIPFMEYTVGKEYEYYELELNKNSINIIDDFWIKNGYDIKKCKEERVICEVSLEKVERCFILVEK